MRGSMLISEEQYMTTKQDDPEDAAVTFWSSGSELTGAVAGTALGAVLGGPVGAVLGAGAGSIMGSTLKELAHRKLSRREKVRIGAAFQYASVAFKERIDAGYKVRADGFLSGDPKGRTVKDEVVEGVLIAAQRQHEERKVEYLGYLLANIAFEEQVDRHLANWVIRTANELSWTQLIILAIIGSSDESERPEIEIGKSVPTWNSRGIHEQLAELGPGRREMIYGESDATPRLGLSLVNLRLREYKLINGGVLLYQLMWLSRIPALDRAGLVQSLTGIV